MQAIRLKPLLLFVSRKWPPAIGGMETYSVELAESLEEHYDIKRIVLAGKDDGHAPGIFLYLVFVLRVMGFCLLHGRRYSRVIFCDLVLFPAAVCHWLVSRRSRRVLVVYGLDLVYHRRSGALPFIYGLYFSALRKCQHVFSAVVAISRYTARLATDAGLGKVTVINPSLPDTALTRGNTVKHRLPEAWVRVGDRKRILYFGRLIPRKGALWFAQSVLPSLDSEAVFFVAGQTSDTGYQTKLGQCENTHLLGRVDSDLLAVLIANADIVVMPNIGTPDAVDVEGFGLAAVEATSLGGVLLASSIDGITDAVIDGSTGLLVPPGDAAQWVAFVDRALSLPVCEVLELRKHASAATRTCYSRASQSTGFVRLLSANRS